MQYHEVQGEGRTAPVANVLLVAAGYTLALQRSKGHTASAALL